MHPCPITSIKIHRTAAMAITTFLDLWLRKAFSSNGYSNAGMNQRWYMYQLLQTNPFRKLMNSPVKSN